MSVDVSAVVDVVVVLWLSSDAARRSRFPGSTHSDSVWNGATMATPTWTLYSPIPPHRGLREPVPNHGRSVKACFA